MASRKMLDGQRHGRAERRHVLPAMDPTRPLRRSFPSIAAAAVMLVLFAPAGAGAELAPGAVLGPENWEDAKGLLPDEFLEAYRRGDLRHEIRSWKPVHLEEDDPVFAAALKENDGRYDVDAEGTIVDRGTGTPAEKILAWPFPKIDPADPHAATKIVWNYFYTLYYGGNGHYRADLMWISR